MKKIYQFLDQIPKSKTWVLLLVLVGMAIIPLFTNLLFLSASLKGYLDNQIILIGIGLIIYAFWLWMLYYLKKGDNINWSHLSLTKVKIKKGILLGLVLYATVNLALVVNVLFKGGSLTVTKAFYSLDGILILIALGVFVFNIFVGAFIEEILYRAYLIPQFYLIIHQKLKFKAGALVISILLSQVLFAVAHLPRDLFRFDKDLSVLILGYDDFIVSGIVFALVYLRTRNIIFVTMYHAFINYGLPIINSDAYLNVYYNAVVFFILIFWNKIMQTSHSNNSSYLLLK